MTTTIDGFPGQAPPPSSDGRQADVRQQRWLYDLEQALAEQGLKRYQSQRQGAEAGPHSSAQVPMQPALEMAGPGQQPATMQAAAPQGHGAASASAAAGQSARSSQASAGIEQGAARGAAVVDQDASPDAGAAVNLPGGPRQAAQAIAAPLGVAVPGTAGARSAAAEFAATMAPAMGARASTGAHAAQALLPSEARNAAAASAPATFSLLPQAGGAKPEGHAAALDAGADGEASAPAPQHEAAGEPFEKRLLHLYYGKDGVHAWLRDAELNAAQVRGVAQALASELGGAGKRLAELTVNGRKVGMRGAQPLHDEEQQPVAGNGPAPIKIRNP